MAFPGRTGMRGDKIGSKMESTKIVRYLMQLAFITAKEYIPYHKWFGSKFSKLPIAESIEPVLITILNENDWKVRDKLLCEAYIILINEQIKLKIIKKFDAKPTQFHDRPILIVDLNSAFESLKKDIDMNLDLFKYPIGTINQFIDEPSILYEPKFIPKLKKIFNN